MSADAPRNAGTAIDSLAGLHRAVADPERVVAWRGAATAGRELRHDRWSSDVAHYWERLASEGLGRGDRLALWCRDAYAFSVGLVAAWQRGCVVVSPPNDGPGTLAAIVEDGCRLASHAYAGAAGASRVREASPALSLDFALASEATPGSEQAQRSLRESALLDRDALALELSTSGTTGDGKLVPKALRHLDDEVAALEHHFGRALEGLGTVATPSGAKRRAHGGDAG